MKITSLSRPLVAAVAVAALALGIVAGLACTGASGARSPWRSWTTLRLEAKAMPLFRGQVEMAVGEKAGERRLETWATARFLGVIIARSRTETVFEPGTGRTKSYNSYSPKRGRRYAFGDRSYVVEKLRPPEEEDAPPEEWEVTSRKEFPYPEGDPAFRLFDYYGMLLHLREAELNEPGDEVTLHVATSKGAQPYRIVVSESRESDRTYDDLATGTTKTLPLVEFRLRIIPADPANASEGFLRMEGETEVWVEADSKTPLEISGKVPKVPGRVRLILAGMG